MNKMNPLYLVVFAILIGFFSCSKDDTSQPTQQSTLNASYSQDRNFIEPNESVNFTNSSTKAVRYEWNFGNGQTSTIANPSAVYTTTGTYTVKLTAYNEANEATTTTSTIKVGERYLTSISVVKMSKVDLSGNPWSADVNRADLELWLKAPQSNMFDSKTPISVNLNNLPFSWNFVPDNHKLKNGNYQIVIWEDGSNGSGFGYMDWNLNILASGSSYYNDGKGKVILTDPNNLIELDVNFQIK